MKKLTLLLILAFMPILGVMADDAQFCLNMQRELQSKIALREAQIRNFGSADPGLLSEIESLRIYLANNCVVINQGSCPSDSAGVFPDCVCHPGTHGIPGSCVPDTPQCPAGQHLENNQCVNNVIICPNGFHLEGTQCVRDPVPPVCPVGTEGTPPNCTPIIVTPPVCPVGTEGTPPNCTPIVNPPPVCPAGTEGTPPNCTPIIVTPPVCPAGTEGTPPNCTPIPPECPAGTHLVAGNHCEADVPTCSPGTHLEGMQCVPDSAGGLSHACLALINQTCGMSDQAAARFAQQHKDAIRSTCGGSFGRGNSAIHNGRHCR